MATNRDALARAEARFGVPAEIITAIIGVETSYGGNKGSYPVIDALYTLAFNYPRTGDPAKVARENQREAFFRDELGQLFALGKETGMDITQLKGSYAGAMGWGQFMPSSYRQYAVDGDNDGKRDLFDNIDDVTESVANYFAKKGGWKRGGPVMAPALRDPSAADYNAEDIDVMQPVRELRAAGLSRDAFRSSPPRPRRSCASMAPAAPNTGWCSTTSARSPSTTPRACMRRPCTSWPNRSPAAMRRSRSKRSRRPSRCRPCRPRPRRHEARAAGRVPAARRLRRRADHQSAGAFAVFDHRFQGARDCIGRTPFAVRGRAGRPVQARRLHRRRPVRAEREGHRAAADRRRAT